MRPPTTRTRNSPAASRRRIDVARLAPIAIFTMPLDEEHRWAGSWPLRCQRHRKSRSKPHSFVGAIDHQYAKDRCQAGLPEMRCNSGSLAQHIAKLAIPSRPNGTRRNRRPPALQADVPRHELRAKKMETVADEDDVVQPARFEERAHALH